MFYFQVFLYLQVLDLLTTLIGLRLGASEASPFVRWLMQIGPATGLIFCKLMALSLVGICFWLKKARVIRWASYWYALLVVWNCCIILASQHLV